MLLQPAMGVDLLDQWIAFCKRATPGTRYWLTDELYDRLGERLGQEVRYLEPPSDLGMRFRIDYRGGYESHGLTFYRRSIYPNPPRRATHRQYPSQQEFYAR
jgi:hypothetical protein